MKQIIMISLLLLIAFPLIAYRQAKAEQIESNVRIFAELDNEYKLVSYFLNHQQKRYYHSLEEEKEKQMFLESFWKANNPNPVSKENEFLELIKERIAYCNNYFSHFDDGWETDRGRIYIRYGQPFHITKGRTSIQTRFTVKDYEVWKYRIDNFITYIFLDQQGHGDLRIIYSNGDDTEMTNPDWLNLLGPDFELMELQ